MSGGDPKLRVVEPDIEPAASAHARQLRSQVVELLEEWLERARAGEFEDIAIIGVHAPDQAVSWSLTGTVSRARRIGMLEMIKHAELHRFDDDDDE